MSEDLKKHSWHSFCRGDAHIDAISDVQDSTIKLMKNITVVTPEKSGNIVTNKIYF